MGLQVGRFDSGVRIRRTISPEVLWWWRCRPVGRTEELRLLFFFPPPLTTLSSVWRKNEVL